MGWAGPAASPRATRSMEGACGRAGSIFLIFHYLLNCKLWYVFSLQTAMSPHLCYQDWSFQFLTNHIASKTATFFKNCISVMTYIKQLFILTPGKKTRNLLRTTAWEGSLSDSSGELFQEVREEPGYTGVSAEKQTNKKTCSFGLKGDQTSWS